MKISSIFTIISGRVTSAVAPLFPNKSFHITVQPTVFDCGDCYAVIWETSKKGSGCVKYCFNGKEKTVWDARSGSVRTNDTIHSVKVLKNELNGNTYKVFSQEVGFKYAYSASRKKAVESDSIKFNGIAPKDGLNILCVSDTHELGEAVMESIDRFDEKPDFLALIGDIFSYSEKAENFAEVLKHSSRISKGEIPAIYTRGNHETRGEFSPLVINYFPTPTNEFYYTFKFGPLSAVVLDTGEDKEDSHPEYSGLVDFNSYREQEYEWIMSLKNDTFDGRYNIVFSHMMELDTHFGKDWLAPFEKLGADLVVCGHHHRYDFIGGALPRLIDGGQLEGTNFAASMLTLKDGRIRTKTIDRNGNAFPKNVVVCD